MVTIKDIAHACGVAVSTVSYALNNDHRIPEKTKALIQNKAKELGYKGKSGKKPIKSDYLKQIVVCLNTINGDIYTEIFNTIHHILHISNCKTLIYCGNKIDNIAWMDGCICLNSKIPDIQIQEIAYQKIPVVLMDRDTKIPQTINVILDNFQGSYNVTEKIIEKGAQSFIYIAGPASNQDANLRYEGFIKALKDNNLSFKKSVIYQGDYTKTSGTNIVNNILSLGLKADAIICANDEMATGVMDVLIKNGFEIGKDIFVGGFDGIAPKNYVGFITGYYDISSWASLGTYTLLRDMEKANNTLLKIPVD